MALADESTVTMYEVTCSGYEDSLASCGHSFSPSPASESLGCDNAFVICQGIYSMATSTEIFTFSWVLFNYYNIIVGYTILFTSRYWN